MGLNLIEYMYICNTTYCSSTNINQNSEYCEIFPEICKICLEINIPVAP